MKMNLKRFTYPNFWRKFLIMFISIFCMGFFLSFLIEVNWGTDPYTFMNRSISKRIGWTLGNWQLLFNATLLILTIVVARDLIGLGTIVNMTLIGYTADFFCFVWQKSLPETLFSSPDFLLAKIVIFIVGIAGFIISAAVYMNAQMGLSPYDATSFIIGRKLSKISFSFLRIAYDLLAVVIGVVISLGTQNDIIRSLPGSVIMALTLGPVITLVGNFMKKHLN